MFNSFKISILARSKHLITNKSSPILPLFFFELIPQIEKNHSIHELDDFMFIKSLANLLNNGNLIACLIQKEEVEFSVVIIL